MQRNTVKSERRRGLRAVVVVTAWAALLVGCSRVGRQDSEENFLYKVSSGETICVHRAGSGPRSVLLLPGNNCSGASFRPLLSLVQETEALGSAYTFYAFDYRGSGGSTYENMVSTLEDFAKDFDDVVQADPRLRRGDLILVGHSMGFGVALAMVDLRPNAYACVVSLAGIGTRGVRVLFAGGTCGEEPASGTRYGFGDWADGLSAVAFQQRSRSGPGCTRDDVKSIWDAVVFNDVLKYDVATGSRTDEDAVQSSDYDALIDDVMSVRYMPESLYAAHRFNFSMQTVSHVNRDGTVVTIPGAGRLDGFAGKRVLLVKAKTDRSNWRGDLVLDDSITQNTKYDLREAGACVTAVVLQPGRGFDHGFPFHHPEETVSMVVGFIEADEEISQDALDEMLGEGTGVVYPSEDRSWERERYGGF